VNRFFYTLDETVLGILNIVSIILSFSGYALRDKIDGNGKWKGRTKKWARRVLFSMSLIGVILLSVAFVYRRQFIEVPDLVGLEYRAARQTLAEKGLSFEEYDEYLSANYIVEEQSIKAGTYIRKNSEESKIRLIAKRIYYDGETMWIPKKEYAVSISPTSMDVDIGEIAEFELSISAPETFETTPYVFYCAYYDDVLHDWVQINSFRVEGGDSNYLYRINTRLLGIPEGKYMFAFDLFLSSNYSTGNSVAGAGANLYLRGEHETYTDDVFDRNAVTREKAVDVFTINGSTYKYDIEELTLYGIENDDLRHLKNCTNLKKLSITGENITNLSPLSKLYSLETLFISSTSLTDLSPISSLIQIKHLSVGGMKTSGMGASGNLWLFTQ